MITSSTDTLPLSQDDLEYSMWSWGMLVGRSCTWCSVAMEMINKGLMKPCEHYIQLASSLAQMFCILSTWALSPPQECSDVNLGLRSTSRVFRCQPRPLVHLKWTCSVKQRWGRLGELTTCVNKRETDTWEGWGRKESSQTFGILSPIVWNSRHRTNSRSKGILFLCFTLHVLQNILEVGWRSGIRLLPY